MAVEKVKLCLLLVNVYLDIWFYSCYQSNLSATFSIRNGPIFINSQFKRHLLPLFIIQDMLPRHEFYNQSPAEEQCSVLFRHTIFNFEYWLL